MCSRICYGAEKWMVKMVRGFLLVKLMVKWCVFVSPVTGMVTLVREPASKFSRGRSISGHSPVCQQVYMPRRRQLSINSTVLQGQRSSWQKMAFVAVPFSQGNQVSNELISTHKPMAKLCWQLVKYFLMRKRLGFDRIAIWWYSLVELGLFIVHNLSFYHACFVCRNKILTVRKNVIKFLKSVSLTFDIVAKGSAYRIKHPTC